MKVEAPDDLQGRMIRCEQRAKMIGAALVALAHSPVETPEADTLDALGQVAFELAKEIRAIDQARVEERKCERRRVASSWFLRR